MQDPAFFEYVRGSSDVVPEGHTKAGMDLYRHLTYLGAHQMLEDCFPQIREALSDEDWAELMRDFIKTTRWTSNFYGDLENDFTNYLAAAAVSGSDVCDSGAVEGDVRDSAA
jgi:hypothetical protein